jgi:hypothetical protein
LLRSESLDDDPLAEVARLDGRRDAAVLPEVPPRALLVPAERLEPEDRLDPEPEDRLDPEDFAGVDLLAVRLVLAVRLARPAPADAAREPPPPREAALAPPPLALLALLPVVFRPDCFRELLVVATSPPFPGLIKRYPLFGVR